MKWFSFHPVFVFVMAVIFCAGCVHAWIAMERASRIKNHPGHCLETIHNIGQMEENEVRRIHNMCAIATCQPNRDVKYKGCPLVKVNPPCYVTSGEYWKEYPECCFEIKCEEEEDHGDTNGTQKEEQQ